MQIPEIIEEKQKDISIYDLIVMNVNTKQEINRLSQVEERLREKQEIIKMITECASALVDDNKHNINMGTSLCHNLIIKIFKIKLIMYLWTFT